MKRLYRALSLPDAHILRGVLEQSGIEVRVYGDGRGLVTLAYGLAGRREFGIELHRPEDGGRGRGRSLIVDALSLVPDGEPVFAAASPGNARSLRCLLAAGFTPIGAEVLIRPDRRAA